MHFYIKETLARQTTQVHGSPGNLPALSLQQVLHPSVGYIIGPRSQPQPVTQLGYPGNPCKKFYYLQAALPTIPLWNLEKTAKDDQDDPVLRFGKLRGGKLKAKCRFRSVMWVCLDQLHLISSLLECWMPPYKKSFYPYITENNHCLTKWKTKLFGYLQA